MDRTGSRTGKRRKWFKSLPHSQCRKCPNHTAPGRIKLTLNVSIIFDAFLGDVVYQSAFPLLGHNTNNLRIGLCWLMVSVYDKLAPRQKCHSGRVWWSKPARFMVARGQRREKNAREPGARDEMWSQRSHLHDAPRYSQKLIKLTRLSHYT